MKTLSLMCLFVPHRDNTFMIQLSPLNLYKNEKIRQRKENSFFIVNCFMCSNKF
jgi:hypothetical protein